MRRFALILGLLVALTAVPAYAAEPCGSYTWDANVDAGKTGVNDWSTATDGCHTYRWNGSVGASAGGGTTTFRVSRNAQAWDLSSPAGGNYCQYSKIHEANMAMAWHFKVADGTEVSVTYACK
jgi:hypothetical protein